MSLTHIRPQVTHSLYWVLVPLVVDSILLASPVVVIPLKTLHITPSSPVSALVCILVRTMRLSVVPVLLPSIVTLGILRLFLNTVAVLVITLVLSLVLLARDRGEPVIQHPSRLVWIPTLNSLHQ